MAQKSPLKNAAKAMGHSRAGKRKTASSPRIYLGKSWLYGFHNNAPVFEHMRIPILGYNAWWICIYLASYYCVSHCISHHIQFYIPLSPWQIPYSYPITPRQPCGKCEAEAAAATCGMRRCMGYVADIELDLQWIQNEYVLDILHIFHVLNNYINYIQI